VRACKEAFGRSVALAGVVLPLVLIGGLKFTQFEIDALKPLIGSAPWLSWMYANFDEAGTSYPLGVVEITTALLLIASVRFPRARVVGGALGTLIFLTTTSLLFAVPIWEPSAGRFQALNGRRRAELERLLPAPVGFDQGPCRGLDARGLVVGSAKHPRGNPGAVQQERELIREAIGVTQIRVAGELGDAASHLELVSHGNLMPGVPELRKGKGRCLEHAPEALGAPGQPARRLEPGYELTLGRSLAAHRAVSPRPELSVGPLEVGRNQLILGREQPIERRLGNRGILQHPVDPHSPKAMSLKEFARGIEEPIPGRTSLTLAHLPPLGNA
jgi:Protein of unknown function, DUF417